MSNNLEFPREESELRTVTSYLYTEAIGMWREGNPENQRSVIWYVHFYEGFRVGGDGYTVDGSAGRG
jgi:hypothetical protein